MVKHIVLLSFKDTSSQADIDNIFINLGNLRKTIPQIKSFSYGKNCSIENLNQDFTYGFIMEFDSEQDRDVYVRHEDHGKFVENILVPHLKQASGSAIVLDYKH